MLSFLIVGQSEINNLVQNESENISFTAINSGAFVKCGPRKPVGKNHRSYMHFIWLYHFLVEEARVYLAAYPVKIKKHSYSRDYFLI